MNDGFQPYCISCVKQKQKQCYNENPDKKILFRLARSITEQTKIL